LKRFCGIQDFVTKYSPKCRGFVALFSRLSSCQSHVDETAHYPGVEEALVVFRPVATKEYLAKN
jgi:hypothetical protein